jgi:hypothetical protein
MKKVFILYVLAVLLISCQKKIVEDWRVVEIPVSTYDWVVSSDTDGLNPFYSVSVNVPEITKDIYLNGLVQCYRDMGSGMTVLPSVRHYENPEGALWTQTIDYEYYIGGIDFYITNSDFFMEEYQGDMLFILHILDRH